LVAASLWLATKAAKILGTANKPDVEPPIRQAFWQVNVFALVVMASLSLGALGG
jgi:hypothetical protein